MTADISLRQQSSTTYHGICKPPPATGVPYKHGKYGRRVPRPSHSNNQVTLQPGMRHSHTSYWENTHTPATTMILPPVAPLPFCFLGWDFFFLFFLLPPMTAALSVCASHTYLMIPEEVFQWQVPSHTTELPKHQAGSPARLTAISFSAHLGNGDTWLMGVYLVIKHSAYAVNSQTSAHNNCGQFWFHLK